MAATVCSRGPTSTHRVAHSIENSRGECALPGGRGRRLGIRAQEVALEELRGAPRPRCVHGFAHRSSVSRRAIEERLERSGSWPRVRSCWTQWPAPVDERRAPEVIAGTRRPCRSTGPPPADEGPRTGSNSPPMNVAGCVDAWGRGQVSRAELLGIEGLGPIAVEQAVPAVLVDAVGEDLKIVVRAPGRGRGRGPDQADQHRLVGGLLGDQSTAGIPVAHRIARRRRSRSAGCCGGCRRRARPRPRRAPRSRSGRRTCPDRCRGRFHRSSDVVRAGGAVRDAQAGDGPRPCQGGRRAVFHAMGAPQSWPHTTA